MTCGTVRERLDEYADGALPSPELHEVELHLASCASCREEERTLRLLLARAAALPKAVRPPRDLWPAIATEIERGRRVLALPPRAALWGSLAAAAAVILALAIPRSGPTAAPGSSPPIPRFAAAGPGEGLGEAEAEYEEAARALLAALEERRDRIAPETLRSVEQNLAVIDEALREVRAALETDPGNLELNRMLAATHRKKVNVLQRVVRLSTSRS
jgi:hypothetical protein